MKSPMTLFTDHPGSVGETYFEHLVFAWSFGFQMLIGSIVCFLHGVFPFLMPTTGGQTVIELHNRLLSARKRQGDEQ